MRSNVKGGVVGSFSGGCHVANRDDSARDGM
jgi:hypothetical protein